MSDAAKKSSHGNFLSSLIRPFLFGLAYFLCATFSDELEQWQNVLSHFWLPSGLFMAGLILSKPSQWPLMIVAAGIADAVFNARSSSPWPYSLWLIAHAGNSAAAALGAWLVRTFVSERPNLSSPRELVGILALGGCVGTLVAAAFGAFAIKLHSGPAHFLANYTAWYASDLLGVILFAPAVISWWRLLLFSPRSWPFPTAEFVFLNAGLLFAVGTSFYFGLLRHADTLFVSIPFVIWAGARFGVPGATFSILLSSITVNWFAAHGYGPLAVDDLSHPRKILENLVSQGVFAFAGLLPAAVFSKLRETQAREAVRAQTMYLLSGNSKLSEILITIIRGAEAEAPSMLCSIDVMDRSNKYLRLGAAPSIPSFYSDGVHALEIGPNVGCCGAAAFQNQVAISEDIRTDPRFESVREIAERAQLRSSWAVPLHDSSSRVIGAFGVFYRESTRPTDHERELVAFLADVAAMAIERKGLEEQFLRAQRMESIGTLAGGVAHDLNNLLTPISLCTEMLREEPLTPDGAELVESIRASAKRGADLVKQVLTFARGVQGARIALNLRLVVNEVGSIVSRTFPKNITFESSLPRDLPLVVGDSTQIEQVLLNLCLNARDAMPKGGTIRITGRETTVDATFAASRSGVEAGTFVELSVTDEGAGMPPEVVDRVFEPFYTTKELGHGTGLGLSTALGIVRSHGGFMDVASKLGHGSTFRVCLPSAQLSAVHTGGKPDPASTRLGRGETLLLVDDEPEILKSMARMLSLNGYKVLTASNGREALELYTVNRRDVRLVITDVMMPVMDGAALIKALEKVNARVPVVTVSGLKTESGELPDTAWHHLPKPFTAEQLLGTVAKTLDLVSKGS